MSGQDLMKQMRDLNDMLNAAILAYRDRGLDYAEKEKLYRIAKAQKILQLKADGVPATTTLDLAKGDSKVALLCFDRDKAEVLYKSALEAINVYKIQVRVLQEDIRREWGKEE